MESSAESCSAGAQSAPSSSMTIVARSYIRGKLMGVWMSSPSGLTFVPSTGESGGAASMSSARAFPASRSPSLESSEAKTTNATSGLRPFESFARWDRDSHCLRTSQVSLLTRTSEPYSGSFPKQGSMRSGLCWERMTAVPRIEGNGSGSWPTPGASEPNESPEAWTKRRDEKLKQGIDLHFHLSTAVLMLPTPSAQNYGTNQGGAAGRVGPIRPSLDTMAQRNLWPTPRANKWGSPDSHGRVPEELKNAGGSLNPMWVEWLMGWPLGWTDLEPSGMDRFQSWQQQHSLNSEEG